jgi:superfamily II DNA/RNA helicase
MTEQEASAGRLDHSGGPTRGRKTNSNRNWNFRSDDVADAKASTAEVNAPGSTDETGPRFIEQRGRGLRGRADGGASADVDEQSGGRPAGRGRGRGRRDDGFSDQRYQRDEDDRRPYSRGRGAPREADVAATVSPGAVFEVLADLPPPPGRGRGRYVFVEYGPEDEEPAEATRPPPRGGRDREYVPRRNNDGPRDERPRPQRDDTYQRPSRGGYRDDNRGRGRHMDPTDAATATEGSAGVQGGPQRVQRIPRLRRNNFDEKEVEELFQMRHNQKGISFDNYESIAVEIVPRVEPVASFQELHVHPILADNIRRCGYEKPTPVQKFGIPVAMAGGDLMACAQTGSGKTAAFLTPIMNHILVNGVSPARNGQSLPIALVLAPTRELALQIFDETRKLAYHSDIFCDVSYGGTSYPHHFENDVLVACPGRLKDLFDRERVSFKKIKYLVLDEADRMLEMGFDEQIEYLVASCYTDMPPPEERQTLMFSATFPKRIRTLAQNYLRKQYYLLTVGRVGSTTKNITQRIKWVEDSGKQEALMELIFQHLQTDLVLIFVETKREADNLFYSLQEEGIPCGTIHGDRKQFEREEALKFFKEGKTPILVATDVASRGLDIPDVAHVIQYDLPSAMDDYTHRIGRTARAGNTGLATAFFNEKNAHLTAELVAYLREHEQEVPDFMESMQESIAAKNFESHARRGGSGGRGGRGRGRRDDHGGPNPWDDDEPRREGRGGGRGGGRAGRRGGEDGGRGGNSKPQSSNEGAPKKATGTRYDDGGF